MTYHRPNVLLLHTDQHRWDAIGAVSDEVHTPNLDRLAADGVTFDRYFVQAPVCMPSRASYLTGKYPSQLDIYDNGVRVPESIRTLPSLLGDYGYHSANLGKLHFLPHANRDHREPHPRYGFDQVEICDEPGPYPDAYRAWVRRQNPDALDDVSVGLPPAAEDWPLDVGTNDIEHPKPRFTTEPRPFPADEGLTHSAFVADRTISYLESRAGREPFLAVAGFYSPHEPWVVPQRFLDMYDQEDVSIPEFPPELEADRDPDPGDVADPETETFADEEIRRVRRGYYAMVSEVDYHVGRVLDALDEQGLADGTLVLFTSDHGDWLGDFMRYGKSWPGEDPVTRVPLIVRWPGHVADPGRIVSDIVEAVDLVPTLLSAAGIQTPTDLQGQSFLPAIEDTESVGREAALLESDRGKGLRADGYRYLLHADGTESLYDLDAEYGAYRNVADDRPDTVARFRHLLATRLTDIDIRSQRDREFLY